MKRKIDEEVECVLTSPFMIHMSDLKPVLSQQIVPGGSINNSDRDIKECYETSVSVVLSINY